jgi:acetyl-CoA carboxylase carboxyltransferase component
MVGPESDADAAVRRTGRLFLAGANLRVPLVAVVVRRAFGLGAMAMVGGDLQAPVATFAWPSATLGPMGLEGAVRLGARRELEEIEDPHEREERVADLTAAAREHASALNIATFAEIDAVIDPADTRARISAVLSATTPPAGHPRAHVPPW